MITPKNLLIVRTDRIGDVILTLPIAGIIKKNFPECRITFLLREYTAPLAAGNSEIDNVIILKESEGKTDFFENIKVIAKFKFDSVIVVSPSFKLSFILFLSGIIHRIGTGYRWYSFLFNYKIYEHRKYGNKHELEFNAGLLEPLGIKEEVNFDNVRFNLKPEEKSSLKIKSTLNELGINPERPLIIIHPGSGGSAVDWPLDRFKELIELITSSMSADIILTGNGAEKEKCGKLMTRENVKNLAGQFDLAELIALIDVCDIFISNSTGPIHIAAALGKYTIGFYPKIPACSPERWGPYTKNRKIFTPVINCSGCNRQQCEKLNCMNSIMPESVLEEIKIQLKQSLKSEN